MKAAPPPRATFRDVFAVREFRALWLSVILSAAGDRLALVALAVLVYDRTRSPLLAAVAYAAGYLPWVIGGLFLSDLADRRPRRTVMVACDAVRAVLVAAMAVPGMPVTALVLLLFAATMFASPFESARASITPGILPGERYALGTAVMQTTYLTAEVAGAAAGGAAVSFFGVRPSLLIDSVTFVASALLIGLGTRARPAAARPDAGPGSPLARAAAGLRLVFGDPALRTLVLLGWLVVFYTIPQGIAAPYAARLGRRPGRHRARAGVHGSRHGDRHAAVQPVRQPPAAADADGAPGGGHRRHPRPDGASPGPGHLAGDLLGRGRIRGLPARGQHRLRGQGAGRAAGPRHSASRAWASSSPRGPPSWRPAPPRRS